MKFALKTMLVVVFASVLTANGDVLVASFDIGNGTVYSGFGPYAGASAQFTAVQPGNNPATATNGITLETSNATEYTLSISTTDPSNPIALFGDYAAQNGTIDNQGNFKITGLTPSQEYNIYMIAPNGTGFGPANIYGGEYIVTIGNADNTSAIATGGDTTTFTGWDIGQDYAVFTNATSDATGEFSGTFNRIDGQAHTGIAGIQIEAVPEPATMALIGIFGGGMLLVRRIFNR